MKKLNTATAARTRKTRESLTQQLKAYQAQIRFIKRGLTALSNPRRKGVSFEVHFPATPPHHNAIVGRHKNLAAAYLQADKKRRDKLNPKRARKIESRGVYAYAFIRTDNLLVAIEENDAAALASATQLGDWKDVFSVAPANKMWLSPLTK